MKPIHIFFSGLFLVGFNLGVFSQCSTGITFSSNCLGQYTFTANNPVDTNAVYYWVINSDTIPNDSSLAMAIYQFDSNGVYSVCLHASDSVIPCQLDTCISLTVNNAGYIPMLDSINFWHYRDNIVPRLKISSYQKVNSVQCFLPIGGGSGGLVHYTSGDTVINGKNYKMLWNAENMYTGDTCFFGFIREDVCQRKVFFLLPTDTIEHLIYDFAMDIGDTMHISFYEDYSGTFFRGGTYRLNSIKNFATPSSSLRREFFLNNVNIPQSNTLRWVEGIGNLGELIYPYSYNSQGGSFYQNYCGPSQDPGDFPHNFDQFLICFEHDKIIYYDSCALAGTLSASSQCIQYIDTCHYDGFCGAIENISSLSAVTIYPNPATTHTTLELDLNKPDEFVISIYDLEMRKFEELMQTPELNAGKYNYALNVLSLPVGMYLIQLKGKEGDIYKKLVIQR